VPPSFKDEEGFPKSLVRVEMNNVGNKERGVDTKNLE